MELSRGDFNYASESTSPLLKILKNSGPYELCQSLAMNPEKWSQPPYQSPCHLCLVMFNRQDVWDRIKTDKLVHICS